VRDNQLVKAGDVLFRIDDTPYKIALLNAQAQLAKAKRKWPARRQNRKKPPAMPAVVVIFRRIYLGRRFENANTALNTATTNLAAAKAVVGVAQATLDHAQWQLTQTEIKRRLTAG
jgi:multidrug resistance efflux pump